MNVWMCTEIYEIKKHTHNCTEWYLKLEFLFLNKLYKDRQI